MILGIDPKVDYAFKHLLGRESTRDLLIDVIDRVLNAAPGHQIQELELLNPFNPKETLDDKLSILDVKARDQSGRQFNVEMQMLAHRHYEKRILYYACKLHQQQLHEGQDYLELRPTISISFLDHVLFPQAPDYHLHFRLQDEAHHVVLSEDIEFHLLELPKFTKSAAELTTDLDRWLYLLRHAANVDTDAVPAPLQRPLILRALEELKVLTQSDLERERYEARRKWQLDYNTGLKVARMEGLEEGEQIGRIQLCEQLLQRPVTPREQLAALTLADLTRLAADLQTQVLQQRNPTS